MRQKSDNTGPLKLSPRPAVKIIIKVRDELNQLILDKILKRLSYVLTTQQNAIFANTKQMLITIKAMNKINNPAYAKG